MNKLHYSLGILLLCVCSAFAADITFPTYVPQDTDNYTIMQQRQAAAIAALLNTGSPISVPALSSYFSETLSSTATVVGTAGTRTIYGYKVVNPNAVPIFVHAYNAATAGAVTVGTTQQQDVWPVAANGYIWLPKNGLTHGTYAAGLVIAATTTSTSTGSTAPTTPLIVAIGYN